MTTDTSRRGLAGRARPRRENRNGLLMSAPTLAVVLFASILPFALVFVFAFSEVRLVDIPYLFTEPIDWSFDNFRRALSNPAFWQALSTTLLYATLTMFGSVGAGLAVALAMRRPFRGRGVVRALLLVPYVLPIVAAATIWRTMLNPQYGIVNVFGREHLGWESSVGFLNTTSTEVWGVSVPLTLLVVVLFEIWTSAPLSFLFITARLQSVPPDIEEAAALDGANGRQILGRIVMPQLRGVILLLCLLRFIWTFQSFSEIYLLTEGAGGTQVMALKVYTELVTRADIGSAASYGLLMSVVLVVLLSAYVLLSRRKVDVE
ncbi:carbohydrate ABC transporter membrane protein 1 (CUT1 family) [Isoptericola sp. CG 20/1183]|uniref:Carbohydrate ABC transporter membrane protein 1 (CUT1 family) n=1 Tax=Isoptericola halotolerans TaxID=300560 RepID=A0ABX5EL55_9MICO|nr:MULTISPECIES: sugar ABC transporter permease [Isoptericola]MCK0116803.1 sugar ABC transporter permease [Isoptericola sp. S6320L]PRZ02877.1 carbohydrate ABC transporter membrane protein 1 (CUT1 family) [Isoptericola sp. CG 20/1183]PRZ09874.1 carbohydrate ABC transporter membrane protein 1 (CUT1 family) [Isoptericola halotolerans]